MVRDNWALSYGLERVDILRIEYHHRITDQRVSDWLMQVLRKPGEAIQVFFFFFLAHKNWRVMVGYLTGYLGTGIKLV